METTDMREFVRTTDGDEEIEEPFGSLLKLVNSSVVFDVGDDKRGGPACDISWQIRLGEEDSEEEDEVTELHLKVTGYELYGGMHDGSEVKPFCAIDILKVLQAFEEVGGFWFSNSAGYVTVSGVYAGVRVKLLIFADCVDMCSLPGDGGEEEDGDGAWSR